MTFLAHERALAGRGGNPVLDPALLRVPSFRAGLLASVLFSGPIASFFLTLSLYLQEGTGRSAWATGVVTLPYALGSLITSGLGVALAARAGRTLLVIGSLTIASSQGLLWWLLADGAAPSTWGLAAVMFIGGLGLGLGAPILVNVILAGVPGRHAGAAGGVLSTVNQIGGAVGVAVLGTVFFNALAAGDPAHGYGTAFAHVLSWQMGAYLPAALAMLALHRTAVPHASQELDPHAT